MCTVNTLLLITSESEWMRLVAELVKHWLLRTKNQDCCDVSKASWHKEEITLVIKMQRKEWEEEWQPAPQCKRHCERLGLCEWNWGGVVCQAVGFYTVYSVRQTLGTSVKTFQALFPRPCVSYFSSMGSSCHCSILMPQLCRIQLHCYHQRNCSLKGTAAIKGWNNERE